MKAFTIARGKVKDIEVFVTKEEAVLSLAGNVGYISIASDIVYKVKSCYGDSRLQCLKVLQPLDGKERTFYHRQIFATPKEAWAKRNAALDKQIQEKLEELKELRTERRAKMIKGWAK